MNGVLDCIRVVELSEALDGPYCAMLLGDFGAAAAWLEKFANAAIPAAPIHGVPEALSDAQTSARGRVVQLEHLSLDEVRSIANPVRFSNTPVTYRLPPPLLGEHTKEILQELGYSGHEPPRSI